MTDEGALLARALGFALAGSLLWLQYWDLKDRRRPEPRLRLLGAFLVGAASAPLAMGLYAVASYLGAPSDPARGTVAIAAFFIGLVGPVEEGAKFLLARAVVFRWKVFDERVDGFVYAAAVALGFAAVENLFYLPAMGFRDQVVRSLCAPLVHTLFAAAWGYGTAHALLEVRSRAGRIAWQAGTVALAALLHGIYDFVLYSGASSTTVAVVVVLLWAAVIGAARHAFARDVATEA